VGTVIGDLLPLALGVAISPVPIIAVILMLLAPRATAASVGFAIGWVVGIVAVTSITLVVASGADIGGDTDSGPSTGAAWVQVVLGLLLLAIAVKQWRGRPRPGEEAKLPKWMAAIDQFNAGKALGLGFLLSAINPKNLLMCIGAGVAVAESGLDSGDDVVTIAVFTVLAASTVLVPVVGYLVAKERMRHPLDELKVWLQANNATVMAVLVLVIGVTLLGKGIGALT
jgi:hypothetical protein